MRFWWVNQNQTFEHEFLGGYLWSPKTKRNHARNPYYETMKIVAPGDLVLSYRKKHLVAVGLIESHCYESFKPSEFGNTGAYWQHIGWRVDVAFRRLDRQILPAEHMVALAPLMPAKYAPLRANGHGMQNLYLTEIPRTLMFQLALLIGPELQQMLDRPAGAAHDLARHENPVQEIWEQHLLKAIQSTADLPETEREQLVYARVGQGRFRAGVYGHERRCRVTHVSNPEHLIASHIKPWRHAKNDERLDPENGLMLTPNVDHLFDRGFISFSDKGRLLYSSSIDRESILRMGFDPDEATEVGGFSRQQRQYLDYHRNEIFLEARIG